MEGWVRSTVFVSLPRRRFTSEVHSLADIQQLRPEKEANSYQKVLNDEIRNKSDILRKLKTSFSECDKALCDTTTWLKQKVIKHAVNKVINRESIKIKIRHDKKYSFLHEEKKARDGITTNPNKCILNLTGNKLSEKQYAALQYGIKYGIAMRRKKVISLRPPNPSGSN